MRHTSQETQSPATELLRPAKATPTKPIMLLVLGPHRSGTSLTARLLECLGAVNSSRLVPPNHANPKGFFEDSDVFDFNDKLLMPELGVSWFDLRPIDWGNLKKDRLLALRQRAIGILQRNYDVYRSLSVLKEPRIGSLLPFWLPVLQQAGFEVRIVCAVRDPLSVANSLARRDGFSITHGALLYVRNWLAILSGIHGLPTAFVNFDDIFTSSAKSLRAIAGKLGLAVPSQFEQCVETFFSTELEPSLRHNLPSSKDIQREHGVPPFASNLHQALLSAASQQDVSRTEFAAKFATETFAAIYPLASDYDSLVGCARQHHPTWTALQSAIDEAAKFHATEMVRLQTLITSQDLAIDTLKASTSWRMTAPLRWFGDLLHRIAPHQRPEKVVSSRVP